jgi:D-inositol-3-phosphate glycosyltransferase
VNILFVLEYYPPHIGGAEVLFQNLCQGLTTRGHKVTVITSKLKDTKNFEVINGIRIHRVRVPRKGTRYWFTFLSIPIVYKLAKDANLIHTTTYNGALPAWLACKLRGKKSVITVHEVFGSKWKELVAMSWFSAKLHRLLERVIIALPFDKYVSVSGYTASCLSHFGVDNRKLEVIYNGIDYDLFNPEKSDGKTVRQKLGLSDVFIYMYYGRPGISKGVEYLIQGVPLIAKKIAKSRLLMLLGRDPKDRYETAIRMIEDLNIGDRIILLDPVPRNELPNYIAASDCIVVPSISEGFGFTTAEACAMGKPVVASNVASLPEVISGKYILIEPRSPKAIAEGIESVYDGNTQDSTKKIFTWDECVEKHVQLYEDLIPR